MTPRRAPIAAAVPLLTVPLLAGCGHSVRELSAEQPGGATLTVVDTLSPAGSPPHQHGGYYSEGALVEVELRGPDGSVVAVQRAQTGEPIVFRGLAAGRYELRPALRPCDGNCGHLDPRTAGCAKKVTVPDVTTVAVHFVVERPCTFATAAPGATTG